MSDTTKRDAVLEEFAHDAGVHRVWGVAGMADEILRLRAENAALTAAVARAERILAALREPSQAVVEAAYGGDSKPGFFWGYDNPIDCIHAAVAAAEQEVGRE